MFNNDRQPNLPLADRRVKSKMGCAFAARSTLCYTAGSRMLPCCPPSPAGRGLGWGEGTRSFPKNYACKPLLGRSHEGGKAVNPKGAADESYTCEDQGLTDAGRQSVGRGASRWQ